MKFLAPALILPFLIFGLTGHWLWLGDNVIVSHIETPFSGGIIIAGTTISNASASISALVAFAFLLASVLSNQKGLALLSLGALALPVVHTLYYVTNLYTSEIRNGLAHVAFVLSLCFIGIVALCQVLSLILEHRKKIAGTEGIDVPPGTIDFSQTKSRT